MAIDGDDAKKPGGDRAFVLGETSDKKGLAVLRQRADDAPVEAGVVRALREGEPITGEVVSLTPQKDEPRLCDVKVHLDARPKPEAAGHKGPPRVASEQYRDGWDRLFGARPTREGEGQPLN